jgi:hypothetical protein
MTLSKFLRGATKNSPFCVLGPFSWAIAHCFGVPWTFSRNMTVYLLLERNEKKLIVYAIMAIFVNYCPQFCGFGVIYKVDDT